VFVARALAAETTSRIRLGTDVLVPANRIAPVAAATIVSLSRLDPGRIDLEVGTGCTARNSIGLGAMRIDDMRPSSTGRRNRARVS
jgi:alkanesulfonate monooxygenase SsuD/methylene tetrahydromethanopterin reductase-like flavin-dependent oxidoreductase (luciferase family)